MRGKAPLLALLALLAAALALAAALSAGAGSAYENHPVLVSASCADLGGCPANYWTLDVIRSGWGKWREYYFNEPFPNTYSHWIYGEAWYSPAYNDSAWSGDTRMRWSDWWTPPNYQWLPWLPNRGSVTMGMDRSFFPSGSERRTFAHRRPFTISPPLGKVMVGARLFMWADTESCVWINGNAVGSGCMSSAYWGGINGYHAGSDEYGGVGDGDGWKWIDVPLNYLQSGTNLFAADARNLATYPSPFGIQYELWVAFDYPPPEGCITSIAPASWQNAGTNVNVTVQASAGYGINQIHYYLESSPGSGQWWEFATLYPGNLGSTSQTATINWAFAPGWMPRTGVHRIAVNLVDGQGQWRYWNERSCLYSNYEWVDPRPPAVTISQIVLDRAIVSPGNGYSYFTNATAPVFYGDTVEYSGHGLSYTSETHWGTLYKGESSIGTTPWSYASPAYSGRVRYHFRGVDNYGRVGNWAWNDIYVDNAAPSPSPVSATAVSASQINLAWSIPLDNGSGGVGAGATAVWGDHYFRVGDVAVSLLVDGSWWATGWTTGTSFAHTGLAPNSYHTYQLLARDNNSGGYGPWHNQAWSSGSGAYTLPVAPNISANRATNTAYTTDGFTFTNNSGWGAGALDHLHYAWDTNPWGCPSAADPVWTGGQLSLNVGSYGVRYLHLMSHNPWHQAGGCATYGPYVYSAYPTTAITRVDVDARQIANPANDSDIFTNSTMPVIRGQGTAYVGGISQMQEYHWGSLGNTSWGSIGASPFVYTAAAFSGHTRFHYRAVDSYGLAPDDSAKWGWLDIFVDNQAPQTPAAPSAAAVSTAQINLSWSIPDDQGSGGVANGSSEAYSAVYGGGNYYRAGNVGVQVYRGSTLIRDWTTASSMSDTALAANTGYTYRLYARDNNGETRGPWHNYTWGNTVTRYTLPQSPAASCDKPVGLPQGSPDFTFTSTRVFGAGGVDHYHYRWNTSPTDTASQADSIWSGGTLVLAAQPGQNYYLHLTSHNPEHAGGGTITYGPYLYGPPPEVVVDSLELDRTIVSPAPGSVWYTNDETAVVQGHVDTVIGVQRLEGNTGSGWETIATASPFTWHLASAEGQLVVQIRAVDTANQVGSVYTLTLYIDPRPPRAPVPQAVASGQGRILLTWATPLDEGGGAVGPGSSRYAGPLGYRAADVATRLQGLSDWGTSTSFAHQGLAANTPRSYVLQARDNSAESDGPWHNQAQAELTRWTLAEPPQLVAERAAGEVYMTGEFRFWNANPWGLGHVDHMHYVFTTSDSYSFSGSEPLWSSGELLVVAPVYGSYYLHVLSHNPEHAWDSSCQAVFGPYLYAAPELTLAAQYGHLVLQGPSLGLPAQVLTGRLTAGGQPQSGWQVEIVLRRPDAEEEVYSAVTGPDGAFTLDAASSGNPYLGCDQVGEWLSWARLLGVESEAVAWTVEWFQVHGSG